MSAWHRQHRSGSGIGVGAPHLVLGALHAAPIKSLPFTVKIAFGVWKSGPKISWKPMLRAARAAQM